MIYLKTESFQNMSNRHELTHWHNNIEIIRVLDGEMLCIMNGENYILKKDDIIIINAQQLHRVAQSAKPLCRFQRLIVDPKLFNYDQNTYNKYILPMLTNDSFQHIFSASGSKFTDDILNILDGMSELQESRHHAYELEITALVYKLFARLSQVYAGEKNKKLKPVIGDIFLYRRMCAYIYDKFAEKISLDDIAQIGNVSKSKCINIFKTFAGHSPIDFLNLYRLQVSINLLETTNLSIGEVATDSGFEQQSYYNRLFLRQYEMTPTEYRKSVKKN